MSIFKNAARVKAAQARAEVARRGVGRPAARLLARERKYPLTTVGSAAGVGFVLGSLNVHPLRVPGLSTLLSGGLAEAVAYGTKLVTELGVMSMGAAAREAFSDEDGPTP